MFVLPILNEWMISFKILKTNVLSTSVLMLKYRNIKCYCHILQEKKKWLQQSLVCPVSDVRLKPFLDTELGIYEY